MGVETSFLVEDFIDAITSQLDRVQDALRVKAVNRPLTYALKDLALELKVFVDLDGQGRVRFRTSAPNESGASVVHLAFTTITKPMIEENTVSLAVTRSPSLREAGMDDGEARRLERLGIRNVAELDNLNKSTSVAAVSRLADISAERLRVALGAGKPRVDAVMPVKPPVVAPPKPLPTPPLPRPPVQTAPPPRPIVPPIVPPRVAVGPSSKLQISGKNLLFGDAQPSVRLGDRELAIAQADDDALVVDIPHDAESGALEVTLPDGQVMAWDLAVDRAADEWAPEETR